MQGQIQENQLWDIFISVSELNKELDYDVESSISTIIEKYTFQFLLHFSRHEIVYDPDQNTYIKSSCFGQENDMENIAL